MNADIEQVDDAWFVRQAAEPAFAGVYGVRIAGGDIPIRIQRRSSPALVVTFAGAVRRSKHPLPQFGAERLSERIPASVVAIADPSLPRHENLTAAWYAGHEGFETQRILPGLIEKLVAACGAERVIFVGGSVGGFAALYYSWRLPGSVAVAVNPQTDLDRYSNAHTERYKRRCWPALGEHDRLSSVIATNLVSCYAERFENSVVYLQSAADPGHVRNHFAPFLAGIVVARHRRLLPRLAYWGRDGHDLPPAHEWLAWVRAAIASPSSDAEAIQRARREYVPPEPKVDPEEARLATALVDHVRAMRSEGEPTIPDGGQP